MSSAYPSGADNTTARHKINCKIFLIVFMTTSEQMLTSRRNHGIQAGNRFDALMQDNAGSGIYIADHRPDVPRGPKADRNAALGSAHGWNARIIQVNLLR